MTTPTGTIGLQDVNLELGFAFNAAITMNDTIVRQLADVTGDATQISMDDLRGKSLLFQFTITSNTADANLRTLAVNAGWSGSGNFKATIGSGVYCYATSTGNAGLSISGSGITDGSVELINNGYILGMGGSGTGGGGGPALSVGANCTVDNRSGYIAGGGGAGGGGNGQGGGGGAGGGPGPAGGGGGPGQAGSSNNQGAGGGRIVPGSRTGTSNATNAKSRNQNAPGGQAGGAGGCGQNCWGYSYGGGYGGGGTEVGGNGAGGQGAGWYSGGGGGGYGARGGYGRTEPNWGVNQPGGGGRGVNLNGRTITWTGGSASTNRIYGGIG